MNFIAVTIARAQRSGARCFVIASVLTAGILSLGHVSPAIAQASNVTPLPPAVQQLLQGGMTLQQLQQMQTNNGSLQSVPSSQPSQQTLNLPQSSNIGVASNEISRLEEQYSARAGVPLRQFGYGLVANGGTVYSTLNGAIQDDYILGAGDQIDVMLQGQQTASYTVQVDRNGQVILPGLPPIPASGRHFSAFRGDLEAVVRRVYIQTHVFVSIGQVRQISVRVVGEVTNPGVFAATGLSTVLDALNLAGGIKKTGSLRGVTLVRGGNSYRIDLYSMLSAHGRTPDMVLAQGDRIVVPPIGTTVALAGEVRRPGIYELQLGSRSISGRNLLALGDGPEIRGSYRVMLLRIRPDGKQQFVDMSDVPNPIVADSEILFVNKSVNIATGNVTLTGAVRISGQFALNRAGTLHDLLPSFDTFAPMPYMLLGVIERTDPTTLQRVLIVFSPIHVVQGRENRTLVTNDVVHILTYAEMKYLEGTGAAMVPNDRSPQLNQFGPNASQQGTAQTFTLSSGATVGSSSAGQSAGNIALTPVAINGAPSPYAVTPGASLALAPAANGQGQAVPAQATTLQYAATEDRPPPAPPGVGERFSPMPVTPVSDLTTLSADDTAFYRHSLAEYRTTLNGSFRIPGPYLMAPGTTLAEGIAAAGGLGADVDLSSFVITSVDIDGASGSSTTRRATFRMPTDQFASVVLKRYDTVEFHDVYADRQDGLVKLEGQVRYPGTYSILRGERLSSLLARAGGLTDIAYPYGAVFTRPSVAAAEHAAFVRQADQMESQLAAYLSSAQITPEAVNYLEVLTMRLRNAPPVGRIAIEADPAALVVHPEFDIMLQSGDALVIPSRPADVLIAGEVLNPGSVVYRKELSVKDYIQMAGGATRLADDGNAFIVYPDGSASPVHQGMWTFDGPKIIPGSMIVVPRDVSPPINWLTLVDDVTRIMGELAITGASLAVIGKGG
jgi:protein involved in polysaccharide export with SLBB domain